MEGAARTEAEAYGETCTCPPLPLAAPQEPPRVSGLLGGQQTVANGRCDDRFLLLKGAPLDDERLYERQSDAAPPMPGL